MRKRAIKDIVLVLYKPKPKDWGSWKIKSPYVTSIIASPPLDINQIQIQNQNQDQNNEEMSYVPHSLYYAPAHAPKFYEDEWIFVITLIKNINNLVIMLINIYINWNIKDTVNILCIMNNNCKYQTLIRVPADMPAGPKKSYGWLHYF